MQPERAEGAGRRTSRRPGLRRAVQVRQAGAAELDRPGQGPRTTTTPPRSTSTRSSTGSSPTRASGPPTCSSGDVQVADTRRHRGRRRRSRPTPSLSLLQSQSLGYQGITFNVGNVDGVGKPAGTIDRAVRAKDPRIRQAFEIRHRPRRPGRQVVFNDLYSPACGADRAGRASSAPRRRAGSAARTTRPKAKQLLAEAGVKTPFTINDAHLQHTPTPCGSAQALQAMVKEGGFDLKLKPVEYAASLDQQDARQLRASSSSAGPAGSTRTPTSPTSSAPAASRTSAATATRRWTRCSTKARAGPGHSASARTSTARCITQLHKDDPLIYLYRQRNLTGVAKHGRGCRCTRTA